ncbi:MULTISPECIES: IS1595 family transposase [Aeromonas]|nr:MULTISPECIES: IS1595 family transposase [Aeromonas]SAE47694.1 Transposase and inactivated derivatives [Enterobacter cloacae]MCY9810749.1 IS1595 family transposase [Aeromonas caviae]MDH1637489.1 IS1595 family transposase [Aeromonas caviae]MDT8954563.1 IS1595 family transposase [Aeromonas caviae]QQQ15518.1 IS1595 family transposase [Aeromonas media]
MAKNKVQCQKGLSINAFMAKYGTEEQCEKALFQWRYPQGFVCKNCANTTFCRLHHRPRILQCNRCRSQSSLISGSIFACTKLPLTTWFLALHLLTVSKTGLSAMELHRQLGVNYNTAWMVKHKLLQAMKEADDRHPLHGIIQLDDAYWGGERRGGKRGRGAAGKTPFVAAVALNEVGHPIAMRMTVVSGFKTKEIGAWAKRHLGPGSLVISDGLKCFRAVERATCNHLGFTMGGRLELLDHAAFRWVNTMLGNIKNSLHGSCHKLGQRHIPRHLAEYCFRFNNRFDLSGMLAKLGAAAAITPPMPYRLLKLAEDHG